MYFSFIYVKIDQKYCGILVKNKEILEIYLKKLISS